MKTIQINGNEVVVGAETLRRIEKIAEEKKDSRRGSGFFLPSKGHMTS